MTTQTTRRFVAWSLGLFMASWIAFDLYVGATQGIGSGYTISWIIYTASRDYPWIPFGVTFALGVLFGHLFVPIHIRDGDAGDRRSST